MSCDAALLELLRLLKLRDYDFTAVTPATHERVIRRPRARPDLRDIFGWNRPFTASDLDPELLDCLRSSGMVEKHGDRLRSSLRVARLGNHLFLHSAFPTKEADAVFFGPDTYRFVRFVRERAISLRGPSWIVDMGAGSGAGAIVAARLFAEARVTAADLNPAALHVASINAQAAAVAIDVLQAREVPVGPDLVIANPPYIIDTQQRTYRDGGDLYGGQIALDWARQAIEALTPGGAMLLYTGASVVNGRSPLVEALQVACAGRAELDVEETDPDVFGEELDQPAYEEVERIAVICATIRKI